MVPQLQQQAPVAPPQSEIQWSLATRIGFRFVFCYFFLYLTPGAVGSLGLNEKLSSYHALFSRLWHQIVPWVGANILGLKEKLVEIPNGSGDQLYDYVLILCIVIVALVATGVWTLLDRKRRSYQQLYQWLSLFLRLFLASVMMLYGASKLFPMQFAEIPLGRLLDPLGHLSPLGLLWTFMGYSRGYTLFGGAGEMLGGLLLVVPRFTTLGALVSLGVLSNVLMLNLCYDVPRKILTTHLVLMAIILILPDVKRLLNVFVFNRATTPATSVPFLRDKLLNRGVLLFQYLYALMILVIAFHYAYDASLPVVARVSPPLRGIWSVDEFASNNVLLPPLVTNGQRWSHVIFDTPDALTIQPMDGPLQLYPFQVGEDGKTVTFFNLGDKTTKGILALETQDQDHIFMTGQVDGLPVSAKLHRVDLSNPSRFLLTTRGFHWVTPVPRWR